MTIALSQLSTVDLRQPGPTGRNRGPLNTDIVATDDKQKQLPAHPASSSPMHHRIPLSDGSHGPPNAPALYDQPSWRAPAPFSSPYEGHPAEQRRTSTAPQPALPTHGYPVIPNRELPQLPPDGPYGRQSSLPGPAHTPPEAPTPHPVFRHMNGTPHEPAPHSAPPDYRPRMSFTPHESHSNGDPPPPPHTLPPSQYPTPVPHMSHTPTPYESGYYGSQAFGIRHRKAARAQQACDQCRARKAKCDEGRPACSHCKENSLICVYKEVPPHKQEKATQQLLDRIAQLEDGLNEKLSRIQTLQVEHSNHITQISADARLKEPKAIQSKEPEKQSIPRLMKSDIADILQKTEAKEEQVNQIVGQELERAEGEKPVPGEDGELSIPVEHTTAAHKLLAWPSIKSLLEPREYDEDYVMKLEEERGLILVYGRGEGHDTSESTIMSFSSTSHPNLDPIYGNNIPANGTWGPGANQNGTQFKPRSDALDETGIFTTEPEVVRRYYQSYLEHVHKLHPFLNQGELGQKVEGFITKYCPQKSPVPANILNSTSAADIQRGAKRKRSCETLQGAGCDVQYPPSFRQDRPTGGRIEKSLENAIILLALALGSICEIRGAVPGPVTDTPVDFRKERIPGPSSRSMLSPADTDSVNHSQGSYYSQTKSHSFSSTVDGRKGSLDRPTFPDNRHLRNVDVIPGLAFYAYASQILGSLQGANGLQHVQAALLAGLYAGQLAHPFQSHGWIYQAARACQVLVRTRRYEQMNDGPLKDLYDFAYWTCLQLESDILAELDLPASGISRSESRIALPKGRTLSLPNDVTAPSTIMMFFYSAQIHLRKVLNRVHTDLYKVEKQGQGTVFWSPNVQEILSMNLELWRSSLPELMKWKDTDPPSPDINVARMRAKYYGARYIIHRPLLYFALHHARQDASATSVDSPAGSAISGPKSQQVSPSLTHSQRATNMVRLSSEVGPTGRSTQTPNPGWSAYAYRDLTPKIRRACKVCIDSAILSTEAFDGIDGRPVVTNIFGTAHAQFGNMLVLSATYMSNLSELVDRNDLERLFKRTIRFLLQSREISPSLRADAKILSEIYEKIFGEPAGIYAHHD
ncbi:C6 finger domain protein [Aspergillus ellipticus CBS 707.79]|uniref:C6 finger domain protein n=1 Tax=Aspergillus ellipticus CBS 707.79 TaxID=1448320 RepID=A0A319E464_9EURO|nr:C6 finger domain protein [Aspergillus ellipticus CBS 707.79]